jgi:putative RecB family exonuclease
MSGEQGGERGVVRPASRPALSPSRAADFKQCPLLYRFRAIDRLPEPPSTAQLRGSVVHAALEQLYSRPAAERGPQTAGALVDPAWEQVIAEEPDLIAELDADQQSQLLDEAWALLSGYYRLEDPTRFDPQSCEQRIEVELADGTLLRGIIDRIDVAPTGELRVVDYKTGKAPPEARALAEFKAMFQMKFYAVALLRSRGVLPTRLRLIYLADGQLLDYSPDEDELLRFEKTLMAIWRAIQSAGVQAISGQGRRGCATGARTTHTAPCSAGRRHRIRVGRSVPAKVIRTPVCRRQTRRRDAYCRGDISCSIVGISSLTVGWMCIVRDSVV